MGRRKLVEIVTGPDPRIAGLIAVLDAYAPPTERAAQSKAAIIELLHTSPDPFSREDDFHHVTAGAFVMSDRGVLLHKHKLSGDWIQPGGHVDGSEWPAEAAVREAIEETGVVATHPAGGPQLLGVDVHHTINNHVHYDFQYLLESDGADPHPPAGESPDVGWYAIEEALELADEIAGQVISIAAGHRSLR